MKQNETRGSIAARVAYCHHLFQVLILLEPICLPKVGVALHYPFAHLQGRLRRWELDLKVGDQHGSSLDSRLASCSQSLGLSIDFQLRALVIHLSRVESLLTSGMSLLLMSRTASTTSRELAGDNNFEVLLNEINSALARIAFTLNRLQKFAANFRYHTEVGLGRKIQDYRRRHDDATFNNAVRDYVQSHYPLCLETSCDATSQATEDPAPGLLLEMLVNMILFRHYRALYEGEGGREEPLVLPPEKKPSRGSQAMVTVARRASALVDTARQKGTQIAAFATSLSESPSDGSHHMGVRNLDRKESVLRHNPPQNQANVNGPCTSEENLTCPVCDQVYHSDTLRGENWKRHFIIMEDSMPDDRDDRYGEAYSTAICNGSGWKERLHQRHGTQWLPLQMPLFWNCLLCCRVPRMEKASRALMMDSLISHMLDAHNKNKNSQQAAQFSIGWTTVLLMVPSETCPICGTCHLDNSRSTTARNGDAAVVGLQTDEDDDAQTKKEEEEEEEEEEARRKEAAMELAWKKTEDCIGKHVLEMALHFAQPLVAVPDNTMEKAEKMTWSARKGFKKAAKRLSAATQGIRL